MPNHNEENLPQTKMDISHLSERVAKKTPDIDSSVKDTIMPVIVKKREDFKSRILRLFIAVGVFGAGVGIGVKIPAVLSEIKSISEHHTNDGVKQFVPKVIDSVKNNRNMFKTNEREPAITTSAELIKQLRKYKYLIDIKQFPKGKYFSGMVLKPQSKKNPRCIWQPLGKLRTINDQNVVAIRVTDNRLTYLLEEKGVKSQAQAFLNGVEYYYYNCVANSHKNRAAAIVLRDPSTDKDRFLDVINLNVESCPKSK